MLAVSQGFKDAIESDARTIKARITMKGVSYTNNDIFNVEYNGGSITGETFNIGSTFSNNIKVTFSSIIEELLLDDQVKLEFGVVLSDSTIEYVKMGTFFITSYDPQRNDFKTVIEASDNMIQLNGTYESELSYPSTIKKVALEIANKAGLLVNETSFARLSDMPINEPIGYTYRQALGLIAQFECGFALFDRNGLLDIRMLSDPEYTVNPDSYFSKGLTKDETNYQIGGINCKVVTKDGDSSETTTLQSGSTSGAQISLENSVMTQTLLDGMYQKLRNLNYFPFSLSWRGNPALEAGDWITVVDLKGVRVKVPNLNYKFSFSGGIKATSSANTQTVSASSYQYQGSLQQQLIELNGRIGAAGNHVYDGLEEPVKPKEKDLWFKPNGPDTEIWIYQNGEWVFQVSTATNPEIAEAIEQAQTEATEAKTAAQDAVDKANENVAAVQANTQLINDVNVIANNAKSQAQTAATNAQTAVTNANSALQQAQNANAKSVKSSAVTYQAGASGTSVPTGAWAISIPTVSASQYLWTRTVFTLQDDTATTSYAVSKIGENGVDGKTYYTHTAYAYSSDGTDGFTTVYPNLNLLTDSKEFKNKNVAESLATTSITSPNSTILIEDGESYLKYIRASNQSQDWFRAYMIRGSSVSPNFPNVNVKPNSQCTFSVWLKGTGTHQIIAYDKWTSPNPTTLTATLTDNWTKYVLTVNTGTTIPTQGAQFFIRSGTVGSEINLKYPKVEEGSTATPHMPSSSEATTTDWPSYRGEYSDFTQADSTNPSDYTWSLMRGNDGKSPILMTIKTSNGNLFKNNLINTVLTATLWQEGEEIDKDGSQFSYIWTKTDADGNADTLWNQAHTYSSKSITITQQDIFRRAQFECSIEPI